MLSSFLIANNDIKLLLVNDEEGLNETEGKLLKLGMTLHPDGARVCIA
jgi:hypothetical protein